MGSRSSAHYEVRQFSPHRRQQVDWLVMAKRSPSFHTLLEVDVTDTRRSIRNFRSQTGAPLSLTTFVTWCLAKTIEDDRRVHGYRWRDRLIVFDDVDVTVFVASGPNEEPVAVPHVVRAVNRRTPGDIEREFRSAQAPAGPEPRGSRWLALWLFVPGRLRRFAWSVLLADPRRRKRLTGTVAVTAVGMYGRGAVWAIPITTFALCMTVGGIGRRPGFVRSGNEEHIEAREYLSITLTFDHDVVDGAPAVQFGSRLRKRIERGFVPTSAGNAEAQAHQQSRPDEDDRPNTIW